MTKGIQIIFKADLSKAKSQLAKYLQDLAYDTYKSNIQYSRDLDLICNRISNRISNSDSK